MTPTEQAFNAMRDALKEAESRLSLVIERNQHKLLDVVARRKARAALAAAKEVQEQAQREPFIDLEVAYGPIYAAQRAELAKALASEPQAQGEASKCKSADPTNKRPDITCPNRVCGFFGECINRPVRPQASEPAWLPIETEPKDGQFLVFTPHELQKIQAARKNQNGVFIIGGVFAFDMNPPTHWMPLPSPPKDDL